jgi:hypothetical protein
MNCEIIKWGIFRTNYYSWYYPEVFEVELGLDAENTMDNFIDGVANTIKSARIEPVTMDFSFNEDAKISSSAINQDERLLAFVLTLERDQGIWWNEGVYGVKQKGSTLIGWSIYHTASNEIKFKVGEICNKVLNFKLKKLGEKKWSPVISDMRYKSNFDFKIEI